MTKEEAAQILRREWSINSEIFDTPFFEALEIAIKALENERLTGDRKCVTCKYCDGEIINKPCRACSHAWADLYEEAEK